MTTHLWHGCLVNFRFSSYFRDDTFPISNDWEFTRRRMLALTASITGTTIMDVTSDVSCEQDCLQVWWILLLDSCIRYFRSIWSFFSQARKTVPPFCCCEVYFTVCLRHALWDLKLVLDAMLIALLLAWRIPAVQTLYHFTKQRNSARPAPEISRFRRCRSWAVFVPSCLCVSWHAMEAKDACIRLLLFTGIQANRCIHYPPWFLVFGWCEQIQSTDHFGRAGTWIILLLQHQDDISFDEFKGELEKMSSPICSSSLWCLEHTAARKMMIGLLYSDAHCQKI